MAAVLELIRSLRLGVNDQEGVPILPAYPGKFPQQQAENRHVGFYFIQKPVALDLQRLVLNDRYLDSVRRNRPYESWEMRGDPVRDQHLSHYWKE